SGELLALGGARDQADAVAKPLQDGTRDEYRAFVCAAGLLRRETGGSRPEHPALRGLVRLHEHEGARAVRRLRTAGGEERGLLVSGDAENRKGASVQLGVAEM